MSAAADRYAHRPRPRSAPNTARDFAEVRAVERAVAMSDAELAAQIVEYAHEVEQDTGRVYVPTFMREAARRLANRVP